MFPVTLSVLSIFKGLGVFLFGNHKIFPKVHNNCKDDWGVWD